MQGVIYSKTKAMAQAVQTAEHQTAALSDTVLPGAAESIDGYSYGTPLFNIKY